MIFMLREQPSGMQKVPEAGSGHLGRSPGPTSLRAGSLPVAIESSSYLRHHAHVLAFPPALPEPRAERLCFQKARFSPPPAQSRP